MPSLSVRTRFEVFKRDRFTCGYCGQTPPNVLLQVDHIMPVAAGGSDDLVNLVTSCRDCNLGKSDRLLEEGTAPAWRPAATEEMQERLEQAKAYMEAASALSEFHEQLVARAMATWAKLWYAPVIERDDGSYYEFPRSGRFPERPSVKRFLRDLTFDDVINAMEQTASRFESGRYWPDEQACRYFYAICHRMIRERR